MNNVNICYMQHADDACLNKAVHYLLDTFSKHYKIIGYCDNHIRVYNKIINKGHYTAISIEKAKKYLVML